MDKSEKLHNINHSSRPIPFHKENVETCWWWQGIMWMNIQPSDAGEGFRTACIKPWRPKKR
jgi:hypothetical protein